MNSTNYYCKLLLLLVLFKLSVKVEWRDALLINAGSLSLLKMLPLRVFFLLDNIDPDDEDAASFFEYLS